MTQSTDAYAPTATGATPGDNTIIAFAVSSKPSVSTMTTIHVVAAKAIRAALAKADAGAAGPSVSGSLSPTPSKELRHVGTTHTVWALRSTQLGTVNAPISPLASPFPPRDEGYHRKGAGATINRIVTSMSPPNDGEEYAFVGLSTGHQSRLATRNDPVAFSDRLKKVMGGEEGGIWAMPEDQTAVDGTSTLLQADYLTPMKVECFMKLVSPNLATRAAIAPNTMIEVYPVQGEELPSRFTR